MNNISVIEILEGLYVKDGQRYTTYQALTRAETDKGVRYELQRCTADVYETYRYATFPVVGTVYYDRFGRICSIVCD